MPKSRRINTMEKKAIIKPQAFAGMIVKEITFLDNADNIPDKTIDFSTNKDGSVVGWKDPDCNILFVAPTCGNKVIANEDSSYMFGFCRRTICINGLQNLDTSNVVNMEKMFIRCVKLKKLDLSTFNTSKVKNMTGMFSCCHSLSSLNVSFFDTSNVRYMSCMFFRCLFLTKLDVSNFNTKKVKYMNWMFGGCKFMRSIDVSNFDTSNVENMAYMFD